MAKTTKPAEKDTRPVDAREELSDAEIVAARTAPDAREDGKFRKTFTVSAKGIDPDAPQQEMHEANKVATLQEALNRGLHPEGAAELEDTDKDRDGVTVRYTYAVSVVPAGRDANAAGTYTPSKAIDELGGSTMLQARSNPVRTGGSDAGLK